MKSNQNSPDDFNSDLGPHGLRDGLSGDPYEFDDPMPFPNGGVSPQDVLKFHQASDKDASAFALHHTLGPRHNQSSPGDHIHDGKTSATLAALTTLQANLNTLQTNFNNLNAGYQNSISLLESSNLTLSTTVTNCPGCFYSFTTVGAHSRAFVVGSFDFQPTSSFVGVYGIGELFVNGIAQTQQAIWQDNGANSREVITQSWAVSLGAGNQTLGLYGQKSSSSGSHVCNFSHTCMSVLILDLP